MRTQLITVAALVFSAAVTSSAQSPKVVTPRPPNAPPPETSSTVRAQHARGTMKMSGCLQAGPDGAAFVVDGAKITPSRHASKVRVSTKYEVRGLTAEELQPHVNQRVELTGQIAQTVAGASSVFLATTVKTVAAVCSAAR
jgi:hypothetical protein